MATNETVINGLNKMKEGFDRKVMVTEYKESWNIYLKSNDHKRAVKAMTSYGLEQPYINNILQGAFDAAWNLKQLNNAK